MGRIEQRPSFLPLGSFGLSLRPQGSGNFLHLLVRVRIAVAGYRDQFARGAYPDVRCSHLPRVHLLPRRRLATFAVVDGKAVDGAAWA
jgi:hypothetical protein